MPRKLNLGIVEARPRDHDPSVPELFQQTYRGKARWVVKIPRGETPQIEVIGEVAHLPLEIASALAKGRLEAAQRGDLQPQMTFDAFAQTCLEDFAHRWKPATMLKFRSILHLHLLPAFGTMPMAKFTPMTLTDWRVKFTGSIAQRNQIIAILSAIFKHAELRGLRRSGTNPAEGMLRHNNKSAGIFLSEEEYRILGRLMRRASTRYPTEIAALRFIMLTGCRVSEALAIKSYQIEKERVVLPDTKTGEQVIWLAPEARACFRTGPSGSAFDCDGTALTIARLRTVWNKLRKDLAKARGTRPALSKLRIHDLRHSFAGVAISENVPLLVVSGLLGHKDKNSVEVYAHIRPKTVQEASKRIGAHYQTLMAPQERLLHHDKSVYAEFMRSDTTLVPFCRARGIEPAEFQKGLTKWRKSLKRNQEASL